jgi:Spy/CpxP family protein refolding chaperone
MRFALRLTTAAVLVAGMAGLTALAQRGGGFGGGMFGGGPLGLLRAKSVQSDLNITEEQAGKLKDWAKDYAGSMREKMQEKLKDIPRDQFREKIGEVMAEINKETYKELGTVLKPEQVKRLKQIDIQAAGARAFSMPDVQSALKLTADQKDKIKDVEQSAAKEGRDLREEYGLGFGGRGGKGGGKGKRTRPDPEKMKEFQKKSEAINKDTTSKVMAVLTDDQKKEWKELTGKPFDVAKMQEEMRGQFQGRGGFRKKKDN